MGFSSELKPTLAKRAPASLDRIGADLPKLIETGKILAREGALLAVANDS